MARDSWYRCKDWTTRERATFDEKIGRSRSSWSKWQYFHCQAGLLFFHGRAADAREEALRLLQRSLVEVKDIDPEWAAQSLASIAEYELAMGRVDQAAEHALEARKRCPRGSKFGDLDRDLRALAAKIRAAKRRSSNA